MLQKLKKLFAESTKTAKRVLGMKSRKVRRNKTRKLRKGGYAYF